MPIISFEDEILGNRNRGQQDKTAGEKTEFNRKISCIKKYWEEKENGQIHDKLIMMFENGFDGSIRTLAHMIVELGLYSLNSEGDLFEKQIDPEDERIYKYADFFEYIAPRFLGNPDVMQNLQFVFGNELPPFIRYCNETHNFLTSEKLAIDYDELDENDPVKRDFNKIIDFIYENRINGMIAIVTEEDEEGARLCFKSLVSERMPKEFEEITKIMIKTGFMKLIEEDGKLIYIRINNSQDISYTGFKLIDGKVSTATKTDLKNTFDVLFEIPDFYNSSEKIIAETAISSGSYFKPNINFESGR